MNILLPIIVFAAIAGFIAYAVYRGKKKKQAKIDALTYATRKMQEIIDTLVVQTPATAETPFILSQKPVLPEVLAGIKEAFRERFEKARSRGWSAHLDPSEYTLMIFPSVRDIDLDGNYSPVFKVYFNAGNSYDGSQYDQEPNNPGGWTYAAEQVIVNGDRLENIFIIADNNSAEYSQRATSYGLEHLILYHNDFDLYSQTADHSSGGGHPLF